MDAKPELPSGNLTAFIAGRDAIKYDEENGTITDNPYTSETEAHRSWYRGYNFDNENPEFVKDLQAGKL